MSTPGSAGGKRCLYEVLGVSRDASPDEIRGAYRRLALQLHPDKASSSREAATASFQELVNAYEILSDPKERSYYDSHRSQILFSDLSSSNKTSSSSFPVDLFPFFSSSAYSGFSDAGRGFYKVYADVFDSVYRQELAFHTRMGLDKGSAPVPPPLLGNLDSPHPQVNAFYSYWMGFVTVMDFAWADVYDVAAGENRRSRRAMEEENRKVRRKARREYNENVRALAEFVKKRDRRVIEMARRRREEEERRKEEERERRRKEEERRKEAARSYEEPEWAKVDVIEEDEDENKIGGGGGESEFLYCVACSKKFKSERQWKNHEQSKKHKERVAELRDAFLNEEEEEEEEEEEGGVMRESDGGDKGEEKGFTLHTRSSNDVVEFEDDGVVDELCKELDEELRVEDEGDGSGVLGVGEQLDEEESVLEAMILEQKSRKKGGNLDRSDVLHEKVVVGGDDSEEDGSMVYDNRKKGRKSRARRKGSKGNVEEAVSKRDTSEGIRDGDVPEHEEGGARHTASLLHQVDVKGRSNLGKNQKTKKQQVDGRGAGKGKKNKGAQKPSNLCEICGEIFESRNKLFKHIGDTGHAMPKSRQCN